MTSVARRSFRAILSLLFLDNLGLTVVYPIFTPLVLHPYNTLLPQAFSLSTRLVLLAILIASFPFAQFLSGPLIGHLADIKGRKLALTLALIGEGVGFFLTGLAIREMNFLFLLFSRLFTGFFAGNMTLCLSSIADLSDERQERSKNFGMVSSVIGIGFVIAIVIGGMLSNNTLSIFFNSSLPFWTLTLLSGINLGIIRFYYVETHTPPPVKKQYFKAQIREVFSLFKTEHLSYLYALFFFFMLGWIVSLQFLSTFLIEHFIGTKLSITLTFMGMGLAWCIGNMGVNRLLTRFLQIKTILFYALILSCATLFGASEIRQFLVFVHFILFAALFASLAWTNCLAYISSKAPSYLQGKLLGFNQSIATISMAFAPLFGGMVGEFDIRVIYLFASSSVLISVLILITYRLKNRF